MELSLLADLWRSVEPLLRAHAHVEARRTFEDAERQLAAHQSSLLASAANAAAVRVTRGRAA